MGATRTAEQLLKRLQSMEEALQRGERLMVANRYAGAVMHEINNPLESITNLVYITKKAPNDAPLVLHNMEMAEEQLARLTEIARATLSFYREQSEAKDFDLIAIAEAALLIHSRRISRQSVELHRNLRGPVTARVFAGEILQVLSNLIINALDAVPETGGGVLSMRVRTYRGKVHISVTDNGDGIPRTMSKFLFQPHHTTKSHGTGLGLWLSKSIAEKHNGTITYHRENRPGKTGTTFRLTLPMFKVTN